MAVVARAMSCHHGREGLEKSKTVFFEQNNRLFLIRHIAPFVRFYHDVAAYLAKVDS